MTTSRTQVYDRYGFGLICEEHVEFPGLPCPWPGCSNGVDTEEIEVLPSLGKERIYRRDEWQYEDDQKTYTWKDADFGGRFLWLPRLTTREAMRRNIYPKIEDTASAPFPTIYHYTNPGALIKIIESGELWLSDYSYLNDQKELTYGADLVRQRFSEVAKQKGPEAASILHNWSDTLLSENPRICVASFSLEGDSLGQWRSYGRLSIGFEFGPLMFGHNNTCRTDKVIYDASTQNQLLDLAAHLTACAYEHDRTVLPDRVDEIYAHGGSRIIDTISFFKHPSFSDEREIRMVHSEYPYVYESMDFLERAPHRFRQAGEIIVPYVTTRDLVDDSLPKINDEPRYPTQLPIKEIVVGPGADQQTLERGVRDLLNAHGYQDVPVRRSISPLR